MKIVGRVLLLLLLLLVIYILIDIFSKKRLKNKNQQPIIAVISAPLGGHTDTDTATRERKLIAKSYVASSYISWLEMAGSRVIIIDCFDTEENIRNKLDHVNGCLFTGGEIETVADNDLKKYISTWKFIFNYNKLNNCPLWATCLGFEFLAMMELKEDEIFQNFRNKSILEKTKANNLKSNIIPINSFKKVFDINSSILKKAKGQKSLYYNHNFGYIFDNKTIKFMKDNNFEILSVNYDKNRVKYIGTIKSENHNIYGTQWHPEKVIFEWKIKETLHSPISIKLSQEFSNFFIAKCRDYKSEKEFGLEQEKWLIYNYDLYSYNKIKTVFKEDKYFKMLNDNFDQFYLIR
jgi:gamma-glutamyl hydrolase